jgi:hypothetical protein
MVKYFSILILISGISCQAQTSVISHYVIIKIDTYKDGNEVKASPMPELKAEGELMKYKRRFEYLIMNIPEIHQPEKSKERRKIFSLYPDTAEMKRLYLEKLVNDKELVGYFEETIEPITNPNLKVNQTYTINELMEVASKFFYCDKVNPDTSVQSHVCIGINGLKETKWKKDYTLLAAFCYEAIFNDFDKDISKISESYDFEKKKSCEQFRKNITSLDKYLEDVKTELFYKMKTNTTLKKELLRYYEANKDDLAFKIIK